MDGRKVGESVEVPTEGDLALKVDEADVQPSVVLEVLQGEGHPDLAHLTHADLHVVTQEDARQVAEAEAAGADVIDETLSFKVACLIVINDFEEEAAANVADRRIENPLKPKESVIFDHVVGAMNAALAKGDINRARGILSALIIYADPYDQDQPDTVGVHNSPRSGLPIG